MQMTAPLGADASFNQTKDWKTVNWMTVRQQVRRLQVRIAKATGWQMPPRANTEEHRFERLEPYENMWRVLLRGLKVKQPCVCWLSCFFTPHNILHSDRAQKAHNAFPNRPLAANLL